MTDPKTPKPPIEPNAPVEAEEVETQHALEQGLGVGARELASLGESGEAGTLEQGQVDQAEPEDGLELDEMGRSASVLDRKG